MNGGPDVEGCEEMGGERLTDEGLDGGTSAFENLGSTPVGSGFDNGKEYIMGVLQAKHSVVAIAAVEREDILSLISCRARSIAMMFSRPSRRPSSRVSDSGLLHKDWKPGKSHASTAYFSPSAT